MGDASGGGWPSGSPRAGRGGRGRSWSSGRRGRSTTTVLERAWARLGRGGRSAVQARAGHRRRRHPPEPVTRSSRVPARPVHPRPPHAGEQHHVGCRARATLDPRPGRHRPDGPRGARRPAPPRRGAARPRPRPGPAGQPRRRRGARRRPARPGLAAPGDARRRRRLPHLAARGGRGRADPNRHRAPARTPVPAWSSPACTSPVATRWSAGWCAGSTACSCRATAASSRSARWSSRRPRTRSSSARATSCRTTRCSSTSSAAASSCTRASPKGLNRVDLRDVGEVAAGILLDPTTPSGTYPVVGPRDVTGPECARVWAQALGRPVRYAGDDDAALEAALAAHLTGYRHDDWLSSLRKLRRLRGARHPGGARDHRAAARARTHRLRRLRREGRRRAQGRG